MLRKCLAATGLVFGLLTMFATPAMAHILTGASATANCTGYSLTVNATDLTVGTTYTIDYSLTVTCGSGSPVKFPGTTTFKATASTETVTTAGGTFTGLTGDCVVTGSATLTSSGSTVSTSKKDFTINNVTGPATLSCPAPACVIPPSDSAIPGSPVSWNGFTAPAGSVVWVNAHITSTSGVPTNTTTTVNFTGVSLKVNTTTYALPNGQIKFVPGTTTPTTVVNPDGSWTTTVSPTTTDIFFDGQAIPVDSNLENGGHGNTSSTLSFTTSSADTNFDFQWQWGAAVYTYWPGNAAANIEPVQENGLQPGAPQNKTVQGDLIQGPRGGGGSNFTGSWSGTGTGSCPP
jgi:hypothetical protein